MVFSHNEPEPLAGQVMRQARIKQKPDYKSILSGVELVQEFQAGQIFDCWELSLEGSKTDIGLTTLDRMLEVCEQHDWELILLSETRVSIGDLQFQIYDGSTLVGCLVSAVFRGVV